MKISINIEKLLNRMKNEVGGLISEHSIGIGRDALTILFRSYIDQDTKQAYLRRHVINTEFLAIGRGGEPGFCSYNFLFWSIASEDLTGEWAQQKTSRQQAMTFSGDYNSMENDYYHSFACFLISGGGQTTKLSADAKAGFPGTI